MAQQRNWNFKESLFLIILRQQFLFRRQKNPRYSIRAFAQFLGVDQSLLCKVLEGKRRPSGRFISQVELKLKKEELKRPVEMNNPDDADFLRNEDLFYLVSQWHHFAIVELIKTSGFRPNIKWMAQRLKINPTEVQTAVDRLQRLGYLEVKKQIWTVRDPEIDWFDPKRTSEGRKLSQKQATLLSLESIDEVDFSLRYHTYLAVSTDPKLVPELKKKIDQFRNELHQWVSENSQNASEVYHFALAFHPVTRPAT